MYNIIEYEKLVFMPENPVQKGKICQRKEQINLWWMNTMCVRRQHGSR